MKKIILLIVCIVFLTGCTLDYEINFGRTLINENISATIDGDIYDIASSIDGDGFYLEKEIVEGKTQEEAERMTVEYINKPGSSDHNLGLAVDFNNVDNNFEVVAITG